MERQFWLPNLSGKALSEDRLHNFFDNLGPGNVEAVDGKKYRLSYQQDIKVVTVTPMDCRLPDLKIHIMNESGLCMLSYPQDGDSSVYYANEAWHFFRSNFDGCSDSLYNCTAMDDPFDVFMTGTGETQIRWELGELLAGLARRFISTVESISDQLNHLWGPKDTTLIEDSDYVKMSVDQIALGRSNELYFDAFMSFFCDYFQKTEWESLVNEMKFRIRKAEIAFDNISKSKEEKYRYAQNGTNKEMIKTATNTLEQTEKMLIIAIAALVVSIVSTVIDIYLKFS